MFFKSRKVINRRQARRYIRTKGMTLIELMFVLVLAIATSYVAFISYKPTQQWHRVELTLAQNADIVMAAQAYHSLHGHWPNEFATHQNTSQENASQENSCADAWGVLAGQVSGVPLTSGLGVNGFGSRYGFSCEPGQILAPLILTQSVPFKYLDYFRRYFYRVELPSVLPTDDNALVEITTRIPPTDVSRNLHFSQVELGAGYGYREENNSVQRVTISGLGHHQGFVPLPEECRGLESVTLDVFATGMCSPLDFKTTPSVKEWHYNFDVVVSGLHDEPDLFQGRAIVQRIISLSSIRHATEPCLIRESATLNCSMNLSDASKSDGWRVESSVDLKTAYSVQYYVVPPSTMSFLPASTLAFTVDLPSDLHQSMAVFEKSIFNRRDLEQAYQAAIGDLIESSFGHASGVLDSALNSSTLNSSALNSSALNSSALNSRVLERADIDSVIINTTPSLDADIFVDPDTLEGSGDCSGYFSATADREITQDSEYLVAEMFNSKISSVIHCSG